MIWCITPEAEIRAFSFPQIIHSITNSADIKHANSVFFAVAHRCTQTDIEIQKFGVCIQKWFLLGIMIKTLIFLNWDNRFVVDSHTFDINH